MPASRAGLRGIPKAMLGMCLLITAAVASDADAGAGMHDGIMDENAAPASEVIDGVGSETARAAETNPLLRDAALVIAGKADSVDANALLTGIREKAKWGELPDRLIEAEGILLFSQGDLPGACIALLKLANPGPMAVGILGEGQLRKGNRYEAAAHFLKAARAFPPEDDRAPDCYRKYLEVKPQDAAVETELAHRLEKLGRLAEAARLFVKDTANASADPSAALRIGGLLAGQNFVPEAIALYRKAIGSHPADKALRLRLAVTLESAGRKHEAAHAYVDAWRLERGDHAPRDRAVAHFEAAGATHEKAYRELIEAAVAEDGATPGFRFKMAVACLAASDRACAYLHLSEALKTDAGNPTFLARLPEAIESDDQILAHFTFLREEFEKRGGSARLVELAARGYGLSGMKPEAARAWFQLHAMAPQSLTGRNDAVLALAAGGDPTHLSLAGRLAAPMAAKAPEDKEIGLILLRAQVQDGDYDAASVHARKLLKAFPETAPEALTTAKTLLIMEKPEPAKALFLDLLQAAPSPEISLLLGGILHGEQDCPAALDHLALAAESFPLAFWLQGECMEVLQEPRRAALAYQTYHDRTGDKEGLLALARVQRSLGDPGEERRTLEALVAKGWAGDEDRLRLASAHATLGDTSRAAELFAGLYLNRTSVPADPAWVDAGLFLGARLAAEGRHDKAIRALSIALRGDSSRADIWRLLGDCQAARRQWKAAFESYAAAEAKGGSSLALARSQIEVAGKLGDRNALAKAYASRFRHEPVSGEANDFLSAWHQGRRNYLDAAHHFRIRLKEHPEDAQAWEHMGNCLALAADLGGAGDALQKAIDLGAKSDEAFVNRARAYRQEGAKDMAASIMDFLVNRNPRSYLALVWSAKFAEEDGDTAAALELYKRAAHHNPPKTAWPELASLGMSSASWGNPAPAAP